MDYSGFYFITDSNLSRQGVLGDVWEALAGGATTIQYREKNLDTGPMIEEAREIKGLCKGRAILIINDRVDVALAIDADGVHIGQSDMPYHIARSLLGDDKIIGVTVHNLDEALAAESGGADYLGVSPIFSTATKDDAGPAAGLGLIREVKKRCALPIIAIGGITRDNAKDVINAGADMVCAISSTVATADVGGNVARFCKLVKK